MQIVESVKRLFRRKNGTMGDSVDFFHSYHYLRHNARRLEHLASLKIDVAGRSVLELGAGIGDHSHYYKDRGCDITITDARVENIDLLRKRFPHNRVVQLDLDDQPSLDAAQYDVTHCYGLLYHLSKPREALEFIGKVTKGVLFLETCVSFGDGMSINIVNESQLDPTQAYHGRGCRPTRSWVYNTLKELFEFVYMPVTQPNHEEFPLDWNARARHTEGLQRAVFIAARYPLESEDLRQQLLVIQKRHA